MLTLIIIFLKSIVLLIVLKVFLIVIPCTRIFNCYLFDNRLLFTFNPVKIYSQR